MRFVRMLEVAKVWADMSRKYLLMYFSNRIFLGQILKYKEVDNNRLSYIAP